MTKITNDFFENNNELFKNIYEILFGEELI